MTRIGRPGRLLAASVATAMCLSGCEQVEDKAFEFRLRAYIREETLKRGNLGGRLMSVRNFLETTFPVEKANPNDAMSADERAQIRAGVEADMVLLLAKR